MNRLYVFLMTIIIFYADYFLNVAHFTLGQTLSVEYCTLYLFQGIFPSHVIYMHLLLHIFLMFFIVQIVVNMNGKAYNNILM